jgi:hypothetical protein
MFDEKYFDYDDTDKLARSVGTLFRLFAKEDPVQARL